MSFKVVSSDDDFDDFPLTNDDNSSILSGDIADNDSDDGKTTMPSSPAFDIESEQLHYAQPALHELEMAQQLRRAIRKQRAAQHRQCLKQIALSQQKRELAEQNEQRFKQWILGLLEFSAQQRRQQAQEDEQKLAQILQRMRDEEAIRTQQDLQEEEQRRDILHDAKRKALEMKFIHDCHKFQ